MVDSTGSGLTSVVFGAAANNVDYVIKAGHHVTFDWDTYGLANGIGLVVEAGAILDFKADAVTYLKPKANIDINGAFYVAERQTVSDFTATEDRENVYQIARSLKTYSVEETLGTPYLAAYNEVMEAAIDTENTRLRGLGEAEMMADEVIAFIETTRTSLTLSDYLDYVEDNAGSYYHDSANNLLYIHTSDSTNPSTKTITGIEPVNRPSAGTENRCTIMFNSSGVFTNTGGGTPVLQGYGWHPEREWSYIKANADLGVTELPALENDLGLQQSDKILIGCGTDIGYLAEANYGVYTISSYVSGTKVTTLSSGLVTARLDEDLVGILSRPIKIARSSGTNNLITANIPNMIYVGTYIATKLIGVTGSVKSSGHIFRHSSLANGYNTYLNTKIANSQFYDCVFISQPVATGANILCKRCFHMCPDTFYASGNCQIEEGIGQNIDDIHILNSSGLTNIVKNSKFKTVTSAEFEGGTFINSEFDGKLGSVGANPNTGFNAGCICPVLAKDCKFTATQGDFPLFRTVYGAFHNCLFEGMTAYTLQDADERPVWAVVESFDHNQIQGNYLAWMLGGTIETLFTNEVVQPGHLIFKPESEDYPVFRDYPITVQEGRIHQYRVGMKKDFTGGTVKVEIIDPSEDPLIDSSAIQLAVEYMPDVADQKLPIKISYKPTQTKQLTLRISALHNGGNVYLEPIITYERFRRKELK